MPERLISEAIQPVADSFATGGSVVGEPILPGQFTWRKQVYTVAAVLAQWRETGRCSHGSREQYVRKHWYHIRTQEGPLMKLYFIRQPRGKRSIRWFLYTVEDAATDDQKT